MPGVERVGDVNDVGGVISSSNQGTVSANGSLISVNGSPVTPHPLHPLGSVTSSGSSNVFINGTPVNRIGDPDACGHIRASGSGNVFVN